MEKITVRKAVTGDAEAIAQLLTEVGKVHSEGRSDIYQSDLTKFDAEGVARMIERGEYLAFVAEEDGKVCGEAICRVYERAADGTYKARKWLYVDDLCVTESMRGSYAAEKLMKAAEKYAAECGCVSVELNCWAFNKRAARFYEKCGYAPQKTEYEKILRNRKGE